MSRKLAIIGLRSAVVAGVAWWLLGDTIRHYTSASRPAGVLRFAHFGTYQDYETWSRVIDAYEDEHPEVTIHQEYVVGWYGLYDTKLRQQMLASALPDVALVQIGPFTALADNFADLTELASAADAGVDRSEFHPSSARLFEFDGRVRALPVSGGNLLIYCNPACFDRAETHLGRDVPLPGADWSMEDFRATARDLTCDFDGDGNIDQFGFWQPRWLYYLPFVWSFGADLLDESLTRWRLVGPDAEAAFAFYQAMRLGPDRYSPHPYEISQIIQDVGFLTGKTAMCINGPWFQPFLAETALAKNYVVAHVPKGPAGRVTRVTWDGIAMAPNLGDERTSQAWSFMRFVCSKSGQRILAATQRALPARMAAASAFDRDGADRRAHMFVDALDYSRTQPRTPYFTSIDRAIHAQLRALLADRGAVSPAEFLDRLAADERITQHFDVADEPDSHTPAQ